MNKNKPSINIKNEEKRDNDLLGFKLAKITLMNLIIPLKFKTLNIHQRKISDSKINIGLH